MQSMSQIQPTGRGFLSYGARTLFILVVLISLVSLWYTPGDVRALLSANPVIAAGLYAFLMCVATVVAPIALLPTVPLVAPILGPVVTGFSCWIGWTVGAVIAFLIARHGGRPFLLRVIDLASLERFESRLPHTVHGALIVALRLALPVDVLSYALGLFSNVGLFTYTIASALGIFWFSFAFAYLGYAYSEDRAVLFLLFSVVSAIIFVSALVYIRQATRLKD